MKITTFSFWIVVLAVFLSPGISPSQAETVSGGTHQTAVFHLEDGRKIPAYRHFEFTPEVRRASLSLLLPSGTLVVAEYEHTLAPLRVKETLYIPSEGWSCEAETHFPELEAESFSQALEGTGPGAVVENVFSCSNGYHRSEKRISSGGDTAQDDFRNLVGSKDAKELVPGDLSPQLALASALLGPHSDDSAETDFTSSAAWKVTSVLQLAFEEAEQESSWTVDVRSATLDRNNVDLDPELQNVMAQYRGTLP